MLSALAIVVVWLLFAFRQSQRFLHFFQIEEYENVRFLGWFLRNSAMLMGRILLLPALLIILSLVLVLGGITDAAFVLLLTGLWLAGGAYLVITRWKPSNPPKKPLVYTARAKRILVAGFVFQAVPPLLYLLFFSRDANGLVPQASTVLMVGILSALPALLAPVVLVFGNIALFPFEEMLRQRFVRMARTKLRERGPTVIGITGSYGKTSTKDILFHILSTKYTVAKTPKSYNTLMGICKTINDGVIRPNDQFFIAELGAYKPGEIKKLCQLLKPKIAILTAVGPMHLERFKTLESVAQAKYELIEALPGDGLAVFNADNEVCHALAARTRHVPVTLYGLEKHLDEVGLTASDVQITREGLKFKLVRRTSGEEVECRTRLLGKHNVSNILAAASVALHLGLSLREIAVAVARLEPTPHRLELKQGTGGITVLDDSYNSNPTGARNALEILSAFNGGKRILVTPGFVELGQLEVEANRQMGTLAATSCDLAILVGSERTRPIREGLAEAGFPPDKTIVVPTLQEGIARLRTLAKPGDTVLLLNDLPDTYELIAS